MTTLANGPGRTRRGAVALLHPRSVLLVTLACFTALALTAALAGVLPADTALRDEILALASPPVVAAMRVINAAGDYRLLVPGTVLLVLGFPRARHRWWLWVGLMIVAAAGPDAVKILVSRPRPFETSYGFPSGHATAAAAYFGAVIYLAGSLGPGRRVLVRTGAVAMIALVAVARVMLRAHWPSDALGGVTLGLALASAAALIAALPPRDA